MVSLFADTDMDIALDEATEKGIHLISMPYIIGDKEIYPYVDWKSWDPAAFYDLLRKGTIPKTCGLSPAQYIDYFEPEFKKGNDILYVHFSSAMSGTFNAMHLALEQLKGTYPDRKFYEIDTKAITILSYAILEEVEDLLKEGEGIEEIMEWAKTEVDHYAVYFYADDLKFFGRSGRVSGLSAKMGNLFAVKPIIYMDDKGQMVAKGKEAGHLNALKRLLSFMEEIGDEPEKHTIYVAETDYPKGVEMLTKLIHEHYGDKVKIVVKTVNPTAGSHCGPDCVGLCFHSKCR